MAGHSKFKNIMHRKGAQDKKRAKLFSRLIREISVAAKLAGNDPESNPRLRTAINNALSANMSNSTRAVIAGRGTPSASKTIDFVTIQTTGNASDFGDLSGGANFVNVGTSDSHGGLS